jgi:hypothetical protein
MFAIIRTRWHTRPFSRRAKRRKDLRLRQPHPGAGRRYDAFTKQVAETVGTMEVRGFEPGALIGPLIDMKAVEQVEAHIADALTKGAKVFTGGKRAALGAPLSSQRC